MDICNDHTQGKSKDAAVAGGWKEVQELGQEDSGS